MSICVYIWQMKILIVEDEEELLTSMSVYLSGEGYLCEHAVDFASALDKVRNYEYSCILLDLMLPGGDGMRILEELRRMRQMGGVIIISAKNSIEDKIDGLRIGADDYLTKPFHLSELAARVYAIIRRKDFGNNNVVKHHEIQIDLVARSVTVLGKEASFTKREFDLLLYFVSNTGKLIPKSAIAEHLSGDFADMLDSHDFIYSHIKNVKRKLQELGAGNYLKTIYGSGYRWEL